LFPRIQNLETHLRTKDLYADEERQGMRDELGDNMGQVWNYQGTLQC
jgi:hypothetical protein